MLIAIPCLKLDIYPIHYPFDEQVLCKRKTVHLFLETLSGKYATPAKLSESFE